MQVALDGLRDGTYTSIRLAATALGVSRASLHRRVNGGKSRKEAREPTQLLSQQEEKALADWITSATAAGHPITHRYIKEMAQGIRESRGDIEPKYLRPLGKNWMGAFLQRHSHLKTKLSKAIEAARIKDVTREQVVNFNDEFRKVIREKNISLENIYNCDETGIITLLIRTNCREFYRYLSRNQCCNRCPKKDRALVILNDVPPAATSCLVYDSKELHKHKGDSTYPIPAKDEFQPHRELKSLEAVFKQVSKDDCIFSHMFVSPEDALKLFFEQFL